MSLNRIDYNKLIYKTSDNQIKVQKELVDLLKMTASAESKLNLDEKGEMPLEEFVKNTQSPATGWMRKPGLTSRWDIQKDSAIEDKLLESFKKIGILSAADLKHKNYDGAVILGTSTPNMAKRFLALQNYIKNGVQFNKLFLMGSLEDTTKYNDSLVQIYEACPEQFKKSVQFPEKMTEHSAMHFFIENMNWPDNFHNMNIISLPSEMKVLTDGKVVKPNTHDELSHLNQYLEKRK